MYCVNVFTLLALLLITSCSKKEIDNIYNGPDWVVDAYAISSNKDEIAAVGTAQKDGNIVTQLAQAEIDARKILEKQIGASVSKLVDDTIKKIGISGNNRNKVTLAKTTHDLIDNIPLSRSRRTNIWVDKQTNILFIRMIADLDSVSTYLKKSLMQYDSELLEQGVTKGGVHTFHTELSQHFANIGNITQEYSRRKKLPK